MNTITYITISIIIYSSIPLGGFINDIFYYFIVSTTFFYNLFRYLLSFLGLSNFGIGLLFVSFIGLPLLFVLLFIKNFLTKE